jgi:hypothetical protein
VDAGWRSTGAGLPTAHRAEMDCAGWPLIWLVWSDYQMRDGLEPHQAQFRRKFAADAMRPEDWERYAQALRSYMPYYTLNAQRVDLRMS